MTDLSDHPYIALCDRAMVSPDSRHLSGRSFQWLADQHNAKAPASEHVTAEQVKAMEDDFYKPRGTKVHHVGTFRL